MKRHQQILDRVGTTLILLGVVEFYLMIWQFLCTTPALLVQEYLIVLVPMALTAFVGLGVFFIAPVILLLRGSLRTAKYLRYLALFGLAINLVLFLLMPMLQPLGYHMVLLKQTPATIAQDVWSSMVDIAFAFWLQALLGRSEVTNAQVDARITPATASPALWLGSTCGLVCIGAMYWAFHGSAGTEAIQIVKADQGTKYDYFVDGFHCSIEESAIKITVEVVGYNSQEIQTFTVHSVSMN